MTEYTPAWPHGKIQEILPNIFFVTGSNQTFYNGINLQHSRNMVIIRNGDDLSLINTVRLDNNGLQQLDALGKVKNIVRIGAFHGRDDAFYLDRYHSKLWALKGMSHEHGGNTDIELVPDGLMPFADCSLFIFETSRFPEGILHIDKEGGVLVTCDSVKNWLKGDEYFSAETAKLYEEQGSFGPASISEIWKQACNVQASDFARLKLFPFRHLLSAHGEPLLNNANELLFKSIKQEFGI